MELYHYMRFFLLILSMLGLFTLTKYWYKLATEFVPVIVFSGIGVLVFFAGLLNSLKLMSVVIFLVGMYGLTKVKKVSQMDKGFFKSLMGFGLVTLYVFLLLKGTLFIHYDNFSHWGLVAREILETNRFPNFRSSLITFQSYATGSASFIYYICKMIGTRQEGMMAFAQALLNLSAVYTLFAFLTRYHRWLAIPILLFGCYVFVGNIMPYDLLVDTVLASIGIALMAFVVYYQDKWTKLIPFIAILSVYLLTVKSSSIFFILVAWGFLVVRHDPSVSAKVLGKSLLLLMIPTWLTNQLWKAHVSYVYVAGNVSKHSVNFASYWEELLSKGKSGIMEITGTYLSKILSLDNPLLLIFVVVIVIWIWPQLLTDKFMSIRKFIVRLMSVYIVYQVSLYLMYLFSMPIDEARNLDSFDRYDKTIIIYLVGLILLYLLRLSQTLVHKKMLATLTIATLLVAIPIAQNHNAWHVFISPQTAQSTRQEIHHIISTAQIEDKDIDIVYVKNKDKISLGYLWYLLRYELKTENFTIKDDTESHPIEENSLVITVQ